MTFSIRYAEAFILQIIYFSMTTFRLFERILNIEVHLLNNEQICGPFVLNRLRILLAGVIQK
jgi:hypothetical protein